MRSFRPQYQPKYLQFAIWNMFRFGLPEGWGKKL